MNLTIPNEPLAYYNIPRDMVFNIKEIKLIAKEFDLNYTLDYINANVLFHKKVEYIAEDSKQTEQHTFQATDEHEARHWVINHLDCSKVWNIRRVRDDS